MGVLECIVEASKENVLRRCTVQSRKLLELSPQVKVIVKAGRLVAWCCVLDCL